jgi:fructose-1,6-bisphosphatase/inositol monophosphatase family enzyme
VATGAFVVFVASGHRPYDIAAAKVIVEAAGGRVTDLCGNEQRYDRDIKGAVVSNGVVHDEIVEIVKEPK